LVETSDICPSYHAVRGDADTAAPRSWKAARGGGARQHATDESGERLKRHAIKAALSARSSKCITCQPCGFASDSWDGAATRLIVDKQVRPDVQSRQREHAVRHATNQDARIRS